MADHSDAAVVVDVGAFRFEQRGDTIVTVVDVDVIDTIAGDVDVDHLIRRTDR